MIWLAGVLAILALLAASLDDGFDERAFVANCQKLARQTCSSASSRNPESVSKPPFQTAFKLARCC